MCKEVAVIDQNQEKSIGFDRSIEICDDLTIEEPIKSRSEILSQLKDAEKVLLSCVKTSYKTYYVNIPLWNSKIYSLTLKSEETDENRCPIVLLHGFGGGVALWSTVLDGLVSTKHIVHAFDLLGFGSSTRPKFSTDPVQAEKEFVQSIEEWRSAMKIEQMIFVGHSFGGLLGASYAIEHPERVRHLVLVDPWGFHEGSMRRRSTEDDSNRRRVPWWAHILHPIISQFNPLATARLLGTRSPKIMKKFRPEMEGWYKTDAIYDYNYLNNAQKPSGEVAFKNMNLLLGQVKRPMIHRFNLDPKIPVTFMYGKQSWVDKTPGYSIKCQRSQSYVNIKIIENAGHQIFAEAPLHFLEVMDDLLELVNKNSDLNYPKDDENLEKLT
uniref:AB hydrolase-1 domain-containing protein n=1 Tax=Acrobeloides nanus TaxID=290746 RepID=A0A914EI32_9BILA